MSSFTEFGKVWVSEIRMVGRVVMLGLEMSIMEVRGKVSNMNNQTEVIEPEGWRDYWRRQRTIR